MLHRNTISRFSTSKKCWSADCRSERERESERDVEKGRLRGERERESITHLLCQYIYFVVKTQDSTLSSLRRLELSWAITRTPYSHSHSCTDTHTRTHTHPFRHPHCMFDVRVGSLSLSSFSPSHTERVLKHNMHDLGRTSTSTSMEWHKKCAEVAKNHLEAEAWNTKRVRDGRFS